MDEGRKKFLEAVKQGTNILVTVKRDPSLDGLAAAIGLSLILNGIGKHATAVFSGSVPAVLEFLDPSETLHKNTDSLQDFIISLDKAKADKLRYKVEDQVVKIFITPYRTALSQDDLQFGQGDFNVDVVVALGVHSQQELDEAVTAHGRILHDATVVSLNTDPDKVEDLGNVNWVGTDVSGLSQMVLDVVDDLVGDKADVLDSQVATALLTGIVAETDRFSNGKTTPQVMQASARLLMAGANQELVASKLTSAGKAEPQDESKDESKDEPQEEAHDETQEERDEDSKADTKEDPKEEESEKDEKSEDHPDAEPESKPESDNEPVEKSEEGPESSDEEKPAEEAEDTADDTDKHAHDDRHDEGEGNDDGDGGGAPEGDKAPEGDGDGDGNHDARPPDEQPEDGPEEPKPEDDALKVDHQADQMNDKPEAAEEHDDHQPAGSTTDATPAVDVQAPDALTVVAADSDLLVTDSPTMDEPAVPEIVLPSEITPPEELAAVPAAAPAPTPTADAAAGPEPELPSKYERTELKHELVLQPISSTGVTDVHRTLTPENDPLDPTSMLGSALQAESAIRAAEQPYDMNRISVPASIPMAPPVLPPSQAAWLPAPPAGTQYQQPFPAPMQAPSPPAAYAPGSMPETPGPSPDEQAALAVLQHGRTDDNERTRIQPLRDQHAFVAEPPLSEKTKNADGTVGKPVDSSLDPTKFALTPPTLGGTLTASHDNESSSLSTDPLSAQIIKHRPIMTHDPHEQLATAPAEPEESAAAIDPESLPSGAAAPAHGGSSERLAGVGHTISVPGMSVQATDTTTPDGSVAVVTTTPEKPAPVLEPLTTPDVTDITAQLAAAAATLPEPPADTEVNDGPAPTLEAAIHNEPAVEAPAAADTQESDAATSDEVASGKPLEAAISNDEQQKVPDAQPETAETEPKASSKPLEAAIGNNEPEPEQKKEDDEAKMPEVTGPSKPLEAAIGNEDPQPAAEQPTEDESDKPVQANGPSKPLEAALAA